MTYGLLLLGIEFDFKSNVVRVGVLDSLNYLVCLTATPSAESESVICLL